MDNRRKTNQPGGRRAVSLLEHPAWIPFFEACNKERITNLPQSALDRGLYLQTDSEGEIKFTRSGRPQMRLAPELEVLIKNVLQKATEGGYNEKQLLQLIGEYTSGVGEPRIKELRRRVKELLKPPLKDAEKAPLRIVSGGLPETNRRKF